jgi:predicted MFS family arabinose efflux permease
VATAGLERSFSLVVGGVLVVIGLAGSFGNPLVGEPGAALLVTGPGHDLLHLVAGALYLHVGLVLGGRQRANVLVVLGLVFLVSGVLSFLAPDLLGLYGVAANGIDQLAHVALGAGSIVVGWMGRGGTTREVRRRVSRPARG